MTNGKKNFIVVGKEQGKATDDSRATGAGKATAKVQASTAGKEARAKGKGPMPTRAPCKATPNGGRTTRGPTIGMMTHQPNKGKEVRATHEDRVWCR